ncbi:11527_t:CDS:2 [Diversispora eburnea]|uniref:11527_t:CDS:1 n=1 Tax=Diversispora eburnea TaxID=1213867 RepID=A0A9N9FK51_9GLOM|nr:11527_t:CDS:2 [Diversispora eburnea]
MAFNFLATQAGSTSSSNIGLKPSLNWNVTSAPSSQSSFALGGYSTNAGLTGFPTSASHQGPSVAVGQFKIENITKATRFSDLPLEHQKFLANFDNHIQQQKRTMSSISSMSLPNIKLAIQEVFNESRILFQKLSHLTNDLQRDQYLISKLISELDNNIGLVDNARRFYDAASQGQSNAVMQIGDNVFSKYYYDLIISFENRLQQYESSIEELERHFQWIYKNPGNGNNGEDLSALTEAMRNQHRSFMAVTGKVALLHENVEKLRNQYLNYRRTKFMDNINPFLKDSQRKDVIPIVPLDESMTPRELAQTIPKTSQFQQQQTNPFQPSSLFSSFRR